MTESTNITQADLDADNRLYQRMSRLRERSNLSPDEAAELKALHHRYYVENDHIRLYWKSY